MNKKDDYYTFNEYMKNNNLTPSEEDYIEMIYRLSLEKENVKVKDIAHELNIKPPSVTKMIKKLGEKHTVILSSHILSEVQAVCDEIMIISKGKLVACDTPEGLTGRVRGDAQIRITLLGDRAQAQKAVEMLEHVKAVSYAESSEKGCVSLVLQTEAGEDIRRELFYAMAKAGLPIMSLSRGERSLEDIFLELTEDGEEAVQKTEEAAVQDTEVPQKEGGEENDSNL